MFQERVQQVKDKVARLIQQYEARHPGQKVPHIDICFDLRGRVAGWAGSRGWNYYMRFNRDMMMNESWDHIINDTVPHELAHIICFANGSDRGHGVWWRRTCIALGGSGERCHKEQVTYAKGNTYVYTTSTGHSVTLSEVRHRKVQRGSVYFARGKGQINAQCAWSIAGSEVRVQPKPTAAVVPPVSKPAGVPAQGGSKADLVRAKIAEVKAAGKISTVVVQWAIDELGMSASLARTYVKNNWNKV